MSTLAHLVNPQVKEIEISGIRQFFTMVGEYPNAIQLTIGQPDFPTPQHVKEAGKQAIEANRTTYTPNAGFLELREAAAQFMNNRYQLTYDAVSEVITTIGASQALDITLRTILEPGCEVLLPAPVYPGYEPLIRLCGATPVFIDTRDTGFKLLAEQIERHYNERTRAIILPYPSNPTGCTLEEREISEIADVVRGREMFVISDEIYSELVYGQPHYSIANQPGLREQTIVINGLSKSHSMTGWRIGFVFAPAYLTKQMLKVHQYNVSCATSISQHAALEALTTGENDAEQMRAVYARRRDYLVDRLTEMGFTLVQPNGAFYVFPSIEQWGQSSFEFCLNLLNDQGLAVVPGSAFSTYGEGHIRISYAYDEETLREGCDRLERYVASLR